MKTNTPLLVSALIVVLFGMGAAAVSLQNATSGAGNSSQPALIATEEQVTSPTAPIASVPASVSPLPTVAVVTPTTASVSPYKDGTYTATDSYQTPESVESIAVTLSLKNGIVTDSSILTSSHARESGRYQSSFAGSYKQYVIGKSIKNLSLSRVSGSSLTSSGFNAALAQIRNQAAA